MINLILIVVLRLTTSKIHRFSVVEVENLSKNILATCQVRVSTRDEVDVSGGSRSLSRKKASDY